MTQSPLPSPPMPSFTNLGDLIRPDCDLGKVAIIDLGADEGPREFTYARLDGMANGVARALLRRGLHQGERVAILSLNRAEYLAAYFGIMRAGLVAVPVNFKLPTAGIHFILRDAGAKLLFCDKQRARVAPAGLPCVQFGGGKEAGFGGFLDPRPFETGRRRARRPRTGFYTFGP